MTFVDDHESKATQQDGPAGMVAQYRQVDHVGVGKQPSGAFAGKAAHLGGTVAVVGGGRDVMQSRNGRGERVRGAQLVVTERLGRRQVQHPGPRVGRQRVEDRELIGQRLARRGAGADHHVTAGVGQLRGRCLVRPRAADSAVGKRANHVGLGPPRPTVRPAAPGWQLGDMAQRMLARRGAGERDGKQVAAETRHLTPSKNPFQGPSGTQVCRGRDEHG